MQMEIGIGQEISTHALREEGDVGLPQIFGFCQISTHALREEGDPAALKGTDRQIISTHALREEGDARRAST